MSVRFLLLDDRIREGGAPSGGAAPALEAAGGASAVVAAHRLGEGLHRSTLESGIAGGAVVLEEPGQSAHEGVVLGQPQGVEAEQPIGGRGAIATGLTARIAQSLVERLLDRTVEEASVARLAAQYEGTRLE